jgi:K+-transporting ATPase ATPase C chain
MNRMKKMWIYLRPALLCLVIFTILCGILYTGVITGIAQIAFPSQANGSLIGSSGSALIAQDFSKPQYLIGRPAGGPTNLSPTSEEFAKLLQERIDWWHAFDPAITSPIPADLITVSGSGVDPHISPAAAEFQVTRIAKSRNMTETDVRAVIAKYTTGRFLGVFGEPAVNVLQVNLALDGLI